MAESGLVTGLPMSAVNASWTEPCAAYTTCDQCIAASMTCHFCEKDLQCHVIGSPSGCITGMSACHHIEDCVRKEPQAIGYGPPPAVVLAVLCLVATIMACLCGCSILTTMLCKCCRKRPKPEKKKRYKLEVISEDASQQALLSQIDDDEFQVDESLEESRTARPSGSSSSLRSCGYSMIWLALFAVLTTFSLMYYPRIPEYQICNQQFDWASIFQSLVSVHPKINYQILTSVSNENRFGFFLKAGDADIHHRGVKVGTWTIRNWTAEAGAVTDMMADVRIEPGYSEAYGLLADFRAGTLVFQINTTISGSIKWGTYTLYEIETAVPSIEFLVGAKYPRDLCKCTEYYTPSNETRHKALPYA